MKIKFAILAAAALTIIAIACAILPGRTEAQRRDYLTDQEIELVRDAQIIDQRIQVLISAVDRRFAVLKGEQWRPVKKDEEKWGDLPTASRLDLLSDISKILQKAIDDIDDVAARRTIDDRVMSTERKDDLDTETARLIKSNIKNLSAALHDLADASRRYMPQLEKLAKETKERKEQGSIYGSMESCNLIIEASEQVERPESGKKKKN